MATNVVRVNGDYKIQTGQGGSITLDTASSDGSIVGNINIVGNLTVTGSTTTGTSTIINTVDLSIRDNTIVLNNNEQGNGVTLSTAGIIIRRGTASSGDSSIIWDETQTWDDPVSGQTKYGLFIFKTAIGGVNGIRTTSIDTGGQKLYITPGNNSLSVHGVSNYHLQVTQDNDIPNKKYVDKLVSDTVIAIGGAVQQFPPNPNTPGWLYNDGTNLSWTTPTASFVGLGNVTNESKTTMFTDAALTGTPTAPTASGTTNTTQIATTEFVQSQVITLLDSVPNAGNTLGKLYTLIGTANTNIALKAPINSPTFTGTVGGITANMVGLGNVTNESKSTMFASPIFTGTVSGVTATMVGLGNVTNESKTTMFASPTFTGHPTIEGVTATGATGTGNIVFDTSPTLVTPTLGVASATSINKVTITAPANSATLTIANTKTLSVSNTLTFTGTDSSSVAFGAGGTVAYTSNKISDFASVTSSELAGKVSDETGSGALVFATSPTFTTSIDSGATFGAFASATTLTIGNTTTASTTNISTAGLTTGTKTINIGTGGTSAAVTNIIIGSSTGTTTTIYGFAATSPSFTTSVVTGNSSFDVFNTTATTVNAFGAATTLNIGNASAGTITINNPTVTLAYATSLNLNGASPSISTSNNATASVFNTNATTGNLFGAATTINVGGVNSNSFVNIGVGSLDSNKTRTIIIGQTNPPIGAGTATGITNISIGANSRGTTAIESPTTTIGSLVGSLTSLTTFSVSGTSISAAATYSGVSQSATVGYGSGATFNITKTGAGTGYFGVTTITVVSNGMNYSIGERLTIPGTALGGTSPANDLTITIVSGISLSTLNTTGNVNVAGTVSMSSSFLRNRIINGDMRIDQRYSGTATANTINNYVVDRWYVSQSPTGKVTAQRNGGANATGGISATFLTGSGGTVSPATNVFAVQGTPTIFQGQSVTGTGIPANTYVGGFTITGGNTYIQLVSGSNTNVNFTVQASGTYYFSALPPSGFSHYLNITNSSSAYTPISTDTGHSIYQWIEGYNISDFDYGKSTAKPITVSFWAYSTVTGIYSWRLVGQGGNGYLNSYVSTFTISNANTWQYFSFVVPGCTTGSWNTDNTYGVAFQIYLSYPSSNTTYLTSTINQWQSGNLFASSTATANLLGTANAVFNLTGVQIEAGTVATPFERRQYSQELALCQRYYQKTFNQSVSVGTATPVGLVMVLMNGATGTNYTPINFMVPMRTAPTTISLWDGNGNANALSRYSAGAWVHNTTSSLTTANVAENNFCLSYTGTPFTTGTFYFMHYAASAEF